MDDPDSADRSRYFVLGPAGAGQTESYRLTYSRWMGAQSCRHPGATTQGSFRRLGAPCKKSVDVVFGDPANGFIADDGDGIDSGCRDRLAEYGR